MVKSKKITSLDKLEKEIFALKDEVNFLGKILMEIQSSTEVKQDEEELEILEQKLKKAI